MQHGGVIVDRVSHAGGVTVTLRGIGPLDTPNRVEVRLEAAQSPGFTGRLGAFTDDGAAPGWRLVSTGAGTLNQPLAPIQIPADDRADRLVVKEIENLEPLDPPSSGDALSQELGRRVEFADVVVL